MWDARLLLGANIIGYGLKASGAIARREYGYISGLRRWHVACGMRHVLFVLYWVSEYASDRGKVRVEASIAGRNHLMMTWYGAHP